MQQQEWISQSLCWTKVAKCKRVYTVWFYLYGSLEKTHLTYYLIEQIGSSLGLRLRKGNGTEA